MTLPAFVTPDQLASSLGVTTIPNIGVWSDALDDASGYLRSVIGQAITAGTVTITVQTDDNAVADIWFVPAVITTVVDSDGNTVDPTLWEFAEQRLFLQRRCSNYTVTLNYGYDDVPQEIIRWTKALAAAQINASANGHLGINAVTSVAIDDGKVTYSEAMTVALPDKVEQRLRATYGGRK
jgi:hypothetical protein